MTEIDEARFNNLESRLKKIEEYIEGNERTTEQQWKIDIDKKLEGIGGNIKSISERQIRTQWEWPMAFGIMGAAIGYNFWVTGANPTASIILIGIGLSLAIIAPFIVLGRVKKSKSKS